MLGWDGSKPSPTANSFILAGCNIREASTSDQTASVSGDSGRALGIDLAAKASEGVGPALFCLRLFHYSF